MHVDRYNKYLLLFTNRTLDMFAYKFKTTVVVITHYYQELSYANYSSIHIPSVFTGWSNKFVRFKHHRFKKMKVCYAQ